MLHLKQNEPEALLGSIGQNNLGNSRSSKFRDKVLQLYILQKLLKFRAISF